jgi:hypothetical protein
MIAGFKPRLGFKQYFSIYQAIVLDFGSLYDQAAAAVWPGTIIGKIDPTALCNIRGYQDLPHATIQIGEDLRRIT